MGQVILVVLLTVIVLPLCAAMAATPYKVRGRAAWGNAAARPHQRTDIR